MAISYIKGSDGSTSVSAAQKIQVHYFEALKTNPFLRHRALPIEAEARKNGGGLYKFRTMLGINTPVRRTGAPTSSTVDYDGFLKNTEVELSVSQPFETLAYPLENGDVVQLDGINYSSILSNELIKSLVLAEIQTDVDKVTNDANILKLDGSSATSGLEKLKLIKQKIANYFAINADTEDWANATSDTKAYDYFTGQEGALTPQEFKIHMHPATFMEISNSITEAGAGSDGQYREFITGEVPMIGGIEIVQNRFIKPGKVYLIPIQSLGTPDMDVMTTRIGVKVDDLQFVEVMRGQHYYDSVLIAPELLTEIDFTGESTPTDTYYTINCSGDGVGTCDVDTSGGTDFANDPTCGGTDFSTCTAPTKSGKKTAEQIKKEATKKVVNKLS